jgi:regulator of protease activity HflC (stomatin/prohibitin superfamily)
MSQFPLLQPSKSYAEPAGQHVSLGTSLRFIIFIVPVGIVGVILFMSLHGNLQEKRVEPPTALILLFIATVIVMAFVVKGIRVAAQWERGVVLRLGKYYGTKGPGVIFIVPIIDYVRFVDTRILALNIPSQKVITKDNVPASVDGALFFMVSDASKAVVAIQDYQFAISQYAQASLRDVVGRMSLDSLLSEREQIQDEIKTAVEERIHAWGIHVDSIRLLDIEMPEELKRMMSRQASAEREKRATITKAEGDKIAAINLSAAAETMIKSPGAMQLRTLQTIDGLGSGPANTVVLFPIELGETIEKLHGMLKALPKAPAENA